MEVIPPQKNWMQRNWPWAIPLGGCLTLVIVISFFIGSAYFGVKEFFTDFTDQVTSVMPIDKAMKRINEYPYLQETLGTPIIAGETGMSNLQILNGIRKLSSQTPLKGPKGNAILHLTGEKKEEEWIFSEMYVILDATGEELDLFYDGEK